MTFRKKINASMRKAVYEKYDGHCAYCGVQITQRQMQIDHMESVYVCGLHGIEDDVVESIDNYMPSCRQCNLYKDTLTVEKFRDKLKGTLPRTLQANFHQLLAIRYGIIKIEEWDGLFYFEKHATKREHKPFDLDAAKNGEPVCMKSGEDVRIICFDMAVGGDFKVMLALVKNRVGAEFEYSYYIDGTLVGGYGKEDKRTLVMKNQFIEK